MIRLIAYDISSDRRLRRVARVCCDYGVRVEKSVFECDLKDEAFADFWSKLMRELNTDEDSLVVYPICKHCENEILTAGLAIRPERQNVYVF